MAIYRAMPTSFKVELLQGVHDLTTDTLMLALYTNMASLGAGTTAYTTEGEVVGTGYTAGGKPLTNVIVTYTGTTAYMDCDNVAWPGADFTTRGGLIYNSSKDNRAVAVLSFGTDRTAASEPFVVVMPAQTAYNALVRLT